MDFARINSEGITVYVVCKESYRINVGDIVSFGKNNRHGVVEAVCNMMQKTAEELIDLLSETMNIPFVNRVYSVMWEEGNEAD